MAKVVVFLFLLFMFVELTVGNLGERGELEVGFGSVDDELEAFVMGQRVATATQHSLSLIEVNKFLERFRVELFGLVLASNHC